MPDQPARLVAIVPVRTLEGSKSRLGEVLDPEERLELVVRLIQRTVGALLQSRTVDDIVVVSPDREVRRMATELGARAIPQRARGLDGALAEARADALASGATAVLVLPADLPAVSAEAIDDLIATASLDRPPLVAVVPDRHGTGTNALLLAPPEVMGFAFGGASRAAHRRLAEAAGARYVELGGALAVDLDTPEDLLYLEAAGTAIAVR